MRWGRFQRAIDRLEHVSEISRHIIIPKSDDAIAVGGKFRGATIVGGDLICMLAAVEFDDELLLRARKVRNPIANGMLATKFVEGEAVAKRAPEDAFGVGGSGAQPSGNGAATS